MEIFALPCLMLFRKTCFVQQQIQINAILESDFVLLLLSFSFMRRFTFTANVLQVVAAAVFFLFSLPAAAAFEIQFCAAAALDANQKAQPRNSYEASNAKATLTAQKQ